MQKLGLNELRERFLRFFENKGHLRLPGFSLVPHNDPSLLLINSGMAPLKPYFTGQEEPPGRRVTTCQKCIRTPDIENVGKTARHGTFFEMLGNFSFGDYFKKEAIPWAWEFITKDLKLPPDRLWVSIYNEDDEAFEIWNRDVGVPAERIVRMGKKDNFWEHGTGPCGPCSEIYFDRGLDKGCGKPGCIVGCDCDRYIEFWNLVFTQFNRDEAGNYTRLAKPNIDTGMGLERLACIMQDVNNLFEVDTVRNILRYICKAAKVEYGISDKADISIRVITDHIRSTAMMVSDGILPSNEGRGYVLRRLLRRAARHGKLLGMDRPFLHDVAMVVIDESKQAYPVLGEKADYIQKVIRIEEERFDATIDQGLSILEQFINAIKGDAGKEPSGRYRDNKIIAQKIGGSEFETAKNQNMIHGKIVFLLHDTYGFPLDLTREIAEENGLKVDETGFIKEMGEQKKKAREALKNKGSSAWDENVYSRLDKSLKTEFTGYDNCESNAVILYIVKDGGVVENAQEGDEVTVILDRTPFYAESGGQAGDTGLIEAKEGSVKVSGCKKTPDGKYLHTGVVEKGIIEKHAAVKARIDTGRRMAIARNHTATHLLHKALRNTLGTHVNQSGSLVEHDRLRFDFTHFSPVSPEELKRVEKEVNDRILDNISVCTKEMSMAEARELGATALFGEKYGNVVRVIRIGDYSMELCGGTHLRTTSEAGLIKIPGERGVAAGIRRIEALTGEAAIEYFNEKERLLNEVAAALKTNPQDSIKRIEALMSEIKNAEKEIESLRNKLVSGSIDDILSQTTEIKGIKVITARFDHMDMEGLRNAGDMLKNKAGTGVIVLASGYGDKVGLVVMAAKDAIDRGIHSGNIIREIAGVAGGGGGGRPDMAQAGGKDVSKINEALQYSIKVIESQIN